MRLGSRRCSSAAAASMYGAWPAGWPWPAASLARFQAKIDGWVWSWATESRTRSRACAASRGPREVHAPGASTGPTPIHTRMPAASRRSSSAGLSACWARVALAPRSFSSLTISSMSRGGRPSPRGHASSCSDAPRSLSGRPLSSSVDRRGGDLAQADLPSPAGLAGVGRAQLEVVERRRRPATTASASSTSTVVATRAAAPRRHLDLVELELDRLVVAALELAAQLDRVVAAADVADRRADLHARVVAVDDRADRRRDDVRVGQRADRDLAVDAAEVEPRAVPALGLHRLRVAPVGADDERVLLAGRRARCRSRTAGRRRRARPSACRRSRPGALWLIDSKRSE